MISLLGHLGSHYSYATVMAQIAKRLAFAGQLGGVMNLDDQILPEHESIMRWVQPTTTRSPLLAITAPNPLFDTIFRGYNNVGIFLSPNTNELSPGHTEILNHCTIGFAASEYCAAIARRASKTPVVVCPLGIPDSYAKRRHVRPAGRPFTFLHLTTDFFLPGRKGTEELVKAWAIVRGTIPDARLVVHAPSRVSTQLYYDLAEQEPSDGHGFGRFQVISPMPRGMTEDELADLLCSADAVVLPSRCEGFGMVILAALVLGVPLITTDVTGQKDFLGSFQPVIAPTKGEDVLAGEDGLAPMVDVEGLADAMLRMYQNYDTVFEAATSTPDSIRTKWTWSSALKRWDEELEKWENTK